MCSGEATAGLFLLAHNRLLREVLTRIFCKKGDMAVVGVGALSPLALDQITKESPDVLVMDSFAGGPHLDFVREALRAVPGLKVVLIGMEPDEQLFLQAVREGVLGYVLKDASAMEVVSTVRSVATGDAVCPPQLCAALFRYVAGQQNRLPNIHIRTTLGLTKREQQLVLLISRGLTNKEIASELRLAEQTVRNHVHRILRKVGAGDRFTVVEVCRMQGLPV